MKVREAKEEQRKQGCSEEGEGDKERGGKCAAGGGSEAREGDIYFLYDPLQSHSAHCGVCSLSGAAWWWMCPES